jgi:hypothetical protein
MKLKTEMIHEREADGRYEAFGNFGGKLYSKVVCRDDVWGWPQDYRVKAHEEILDAVNRDRGTR